MPTDDEPADDAVAGSDDAENEASRRRLIRRIALLALLIPIVVELFTFGGLLRRELFGGGDTPTATPSRTDVRDAVGVGDELLAETAASETITTSEVRTADDGWTYVLRITVENGTDASVELRVESIELRDGSTVEGVATTGKIPPGENGELTRAWDLPDQTMPTGVTATATQDDEEVVSRTVPIERPPVQG